MTVPFMRAYTDLLVQTCHKRGAHAIGGMAAFIPSRKDEKVNQIALAKVREDKERECTDGFDGTWVAHPDLVPVAKAPFDRVLGNQPHQKNILREDVRVTGEQLLNFHIEGGRITEEGLRNNLSVAILYLESWLQGVGAAGINNLMEDAATAEISRSQLWQWIHHPTAAIGKRKIDTQFVREVLAEEVEKISKSIGEEQFANGKFVSAVELLDELITQNDFEEFLTLRAYEHLD